MLKSVLQIGKVAAVALSCAFASLAAQSAAQSSPFGCAQLSTGHFNASVEGRDGVFFRVNPDLRNFLPMPDEVIAKLAALTAELAAQGTGLVIVQIPTKSLAMPEFLNIRTRDFGYDPDIAATVYLDNLRRLRQGNVRALNARNVLLNNPSQPFFKTDHRLTSQGTRLVAQAVAEELRKSPFYAPLARHSYSTEKTGVARLDSKLRPALQQRCEMTLPEVTTDTYRTTLVNAAEQGDVGVIALVGSEYSNAPELNFAGFLAEETGLEVIQYSLDGGGAMGAISTYLTSREFQVARPDFLVWELPVYANPGARGPQPMLEVIAAAANRCTFEITTDFDAETPRLLTGDLSNLPEGPPPVLLVDFDRPEARNSRFRFRNNNGEVLSRVIERLPTQVPTGRFYMTMDGMWPEGAIDVEITSDTEFGLKPRLFACEGAKR